MTASNRKIDAAKIEPILGSIRSPDPDLAPVLVLGLDVEGNGKAGALVGKTAATGAGDGCLGLLIDRQHLDHDDKGRFDRHRVARGIAACGFGEAGATSIHPTQR